MKYLKVINASSQTEDETVLYYSISENFSILKQEPKKETIFYFLDGSSFELDIVGEFQIINEYTSKYSTLTRVEMGCNVTSIVDYAFSEYECPKLKTIVLPNTLTTIGLQVFWYCTSLEEIEIPDSVTSVGYSLCLNCYSLKSAKVGSGLTSLPEDTFNDCGALTSVTLTNNIEEFGSQCFFGDSNLTTFTIPDSIKVIGEKSFRFCQKLKTIIYQGNTYTSKTSLITALTNNGVSIGINAFEDTDLDS